MYPDDDAPVSKRYDNLHTPAPIQPAKLDWFTILALLLGLALPILLVSVIIYALT